MFAHSKHLCQSRWCALHWSHHLSYFEYTMIPSLAYCFDTFVNIQAEFGYLTGSTFSPVREPGAETTATASQDVQCLVLSKVLRRARAGGASRAHVGDEFSRFHDPPSRDETFQPQPEPAKPLKARRSRRNPFRGYLKLWASLSPGSKKKRLRKKGFCKVLPVATAVQVGGRRPRAPASRAPASDAAGPRRRASTEQCAP